MKKLVLILFMATFVLACGSKKQEGLTPEQEVQMVDSVAKDIQQDKADTQKKVDSLSTEVDSLLQGI